MKRMEVAEGVFTIADVVTAAECANLASRPESRGSEEAAINTQRKTL